MNARSNGRICQNPFLNIVEPVISEAQYSSFIISSTGLQMSRDFWGIFVFFYSFLQNPNLHAF